MTQKVDIKTTAAAIRVKAFEALSEFNTDKEGVASSKVDKSLYENTLEINNLTPEVVGKVNDHNVAFVTGTMQATIDVAATKMSSDKKLDEVHASFAMTGRGNGVDVVTKRSSERTITLGEDKGKTVAVPFATRATVSFGGSSTTSAMRAARQEAQDAAVAKMKK
jgi:hypothetical protein